MPMLEISNAAISLSMRENGTEVVITDRRRMCSWLLDESTRYVSNKARRMERDAFKYENAHGKNSIVGLTGRGRAGKQGDNAIRCWYTTPNGNVLQTWTLEKDRIIVTAHPEVENAASSVALPGAFRPMKSDAFLSVVPHTQGIIHKGNGPAFYKALANPAFIFMCFYGQMSERGALLSIMETDIDAVLVWEKTSAGRVNLLWVQQPRLGRLAYVRETVLMFTDPDITPLCKAYRIYEIEKGRFKTWKEKVAERPNVARVLGGMTAFIGYHNDPQLDYAANIAKLKAMGVEKAWFVPVFIGSAPAPKNPEMEAAFSLDGKRVKSIDITRLNSLIQRHGYSSMGFVYITAQPPGKGKNPYRNLMLDEDGKPRFNWSMAGATFYYLHPAKRIEYTRRLIDKHLKGVNGVHFDTLTANWLWEDYTPGRVEDASADWNGIIEMMKYAGSKNMFISAEGFCGRLTPYYDLGSTKFEHMVCRDEYYCAPLTMLVYHDCAYHTWWEGDSYNNPLHRSQFGRGWTDRYYFGGGYPALQSAIDAASGTPPDIMPFGLQYTFVPKNAPDVFFYRMRIDEPGLADALPYAKAVQKVQKRIAAQEMVELKIHRDDGSIQETVFRDGTRIIANFSNTVLDAPGVGRMEPETWTER